jgi:hypothetical protein
MLISKSFTESLLLLKKITEGKDGKLYITYKDGEVDRLNLRGIKKEHLPLLRNELEKKITA